MIEGDNRLPILAAEIKIAHAGVKDAASVAAEHAINAGRALIEAKALLRHGEWLPWLKEHVGFSDRTAQLYMKIVRLGFESATVTDLGLKAAASAIAVFQDPDYDPFYGSSEVEILEWLLFAFFLARSGMTMEAAWQHVEWLLQGKKAFPLNDWLGPQGDTWRVRAGYSRPACGAGFVRDWQAFKDGNIWRSRAEVESWLEEESAKERQRQPSKKRRVRYAGGAR